MRILFLIALMFGAAPAGADSVGYRFTWSGAGGYEMRGFMAFDASLARLSRVYETDISCFEITGYLEDRKVGRWALGMLTLDTTWTLTFDPRRSEFLVYGPENSMPQAWNMDGAGFNCGRPGFGFNIGSAAQDLCIDGELIVASQVDPPRPFPVVPDPGPKFSQDACRPELMMSAIAP